MVTKQKHFKRIYGVDNFQKKTIPTYKIKLNWKCQIQLLISTTCFANMQLLLILWYVFNRTQPTGSHQLTGWFALVSLFWLMENKSKHLWNLVCLVSSVFCLLTYVLCPSLFLKKLIMLYFIVDVSNENVWGGLGGG